MQPSRFVSILTRQRQSNIGISYLILARDEAVGELLQQSTTKLRQLYCTSEAGASVCGFYFAVIGSLYRGDIIRVSGVCWRPIFKFCKPDLLVQFWHVDILFCLQVLVQDQVVGPLSPPFRAVASGGKVKVRLFIQRVSLRF